MIRATVSSWSCFCWLYRASPSLAAKNIINLTGPEYTVEQESFPGKSRLLVSLPRCQKCERIGLDLRDQFSYWYNTSNVLCVYKAGTGIAYSSCSWNPYSQTHEQNGRSLFLAAKFYSGWLFNKDNWNNSYIIVFNVIFSSKCVCSYKICVSCGEYLIFLNVIIKYISFSFPLSTTFLIFIHVGT